MTANDLARRLRIQDNVRKALAYNGLNADKAAAKCTLSPGRIRQMMQGVYIPKDSEAISLAEALDISADSMLGEEELYLASREPSDI